MLYAIVGGSYGDCGEIGEDLLEQQMLGELESKIL